MDWLNILFSLNERIMLSLVFIYLLPTFYIAASTPSDNPLPRVRCLIQIYIPCIAQCGYTPSPTLLYHHMGKPYPIPDQNGQSVYPFSDQNSAKNLLNGAAHTYMAYVRQYPPPSPGLLVI